MVLGIAEALASSFFPTNYVVHIGIGILTILILRAFSQGRKTNRERDLHARTILLTGAFAPLGLTILQNLAQRGAHIIALSRDPIDSPNVTILISLLRTTTGNEQIFAEHCDLSSPSSIRSFCTKFLTGKEQRLDAIVFTHEHKHIGSPSFLSARSKEEDQKERDAGSLASFLISTLLLPALLVAPVQRDIRIVNVVNPFYAAAAGLPLSTAASAKGKSIFIREGLRSLRSIVFMRHLQRVLDALPTAQVPKTEEGSRAVPVVNPKIQKSNIVAVSVSPGIGRVDTISSLLNADLMSPTGSYLGLLVYLVLQPFLRIFTKSPTGAIQSALHVLFLPTPFKILSQTTVISTGKDKNRETPLDISPLRIPEEVLLPGALYADCAAVKLMVKIPEDVKEKDRKAQMEEAKQKHEKVKGKGKMKEGVPMNEEVVGIADDGEYGGELAGRLVWEEYESALKVWEKENPAKAEEPKEEEEEVHVSPEQDGDEASVY